MKTGVPHNPFGADPSAEGVEKAQAVFRCLSKLVLGKKIYAPNNPTLVKFANEFDAALHDFFIDEDELVVSIDKFAIRWEDHVVYENDKRDESIAFLLYKDGVGEVSIHRSVSPVEMETFVDLIKNEVRNPSQEEDVVTKLWKADLEHISYRVLDEYLVGEFGEGRVGEGEAPQGILEHEDHPEIPSFEDKGRIIVGDVKDLPSIGHYLQDLVLRSGPTSSGTDEEERFQDAMETIFAISAGELRHCHDQMMKQKQIDALVSFIDSYLDFTLMRENTSAIRDVMNVIECLVDKIISELNGVVLAQTLTGVRRFASKSVAPPNIQSFLQNLEKRLTDPSVLLSLGETTRNSGDGSKSVLQFYAIVGDRAIPAVLRLLDENDDPRFHKIACDTLVRLAGDRLSEIINGLNIDKPQIARDVIRLMKATKPGEVPRVIKELMYYPDFQVRAEAIHFLAGFGDDESALLLVRLLDDTEKNTRLRAITEMSEMNHPIARNRIEEIAFGKDLGNKELDEQIEIFRALGKLCGPELIPRLQQIAGKKQLFFFGRRKRKGSKLLAVYALEQLRDPGATALLETLAGDADEHVSAKAAQVIESLKSKRDSADGSDA